MLFVNRFRFHASLSHYTTLGFLRYCLFFFLMLWLKIDVCLLTPWGDVFVLSLRAGQTPDLDPRHEAPDRHVSESSRGW